MNVAVVLGSRPPRLFHVNGNAIYNLTHPWLISVLACKIVAMFEISGFRWEDTLLVICYMDK